MRCGHCKEEHVTIEHVRGCATGNTIVAVKPDFATAYVEKKDFAPMALTDDLPASYYALDTDNGLAFYEVSYGKKGRWEGFQFLSRLVGHPGDWMKFPIKGAEKKSVLADIALDAKEAAARYGKNFTTCAVCRSPLSDPESIALGIGPVCAARF